MTEQTMYYIYVSTLADWDPVKTIFLFAPSDRCRNLEDAERFAEETGWKEEAEKERCVLVVPVVETDWNSCSSSLPLEIYTKLRNSVYGKQGHTIWGRKGLLWL